MKSMTILDYQNILIFIQNHHRFGNIRNDEEREYVKLNFPKLNANYGLSIKYVNSKYDTREGRIWGVSLVRLGGLTYEFRTNSLVGVDHQPEYENLYDCVMAYLTGNLNNTEIFKQERM